MTEPSNAEQATWSDATRDYVHALQVENERLRALVESAYEEGWEDATCQPMGLEVNWNHSKTRAALQPKEGEQ